MFDTLALFAIGLVLVLTTVGTAFVFGLALQPMIKLLIEDARIRVSN